MLKFCRERVDPSHLRGYMTASCAKSFPEELPKLERGIRIFAEAKRRQYPKAT